VTPSHPEPIPSSTPQQSGFCTQRLKRISTGLQAEIAAGKLPGAVLAIARHGKLAFFEAFGYLDKQNNVPMRTDAVFSIASMTKPLVSVAALSLYEEGRLLVNEPVGRYLPQLAHMRVRTEAADANGHNSTGSIPAHRQVTIQDLMRHTAGMTYGNRGSTEFHKNYLSSSSIVAEQMTGPCVSSAARLSSS